MPQRYSHLDRSAAQSELARALTELREEVGVPGDFTSAALAEAESAAPAQPDNDLRHLPFVTLDPPGARDLDQALHLERAVRGFTVRYAIADVPAFVRANGALDAEVQLRGQTLYAADGSIPLHPRTLSENRASLLPREDRLAIVWTFTLDNDGEVREFHLDRAVIRSRAQLDYATVQNALNRREETPVNLLGVIGPLRQEIEHDRGGASLSLPDESVVIHDDGTYGIERRHPLAVEEWNAQISLMTGMAAAELMLNARVGVLRTMPRPDRRAFASFRRQTQALGNPWTDGEYGDYLRGLDRTDPRTLSVLQAAASLFRGAGYAVFDGELPEETVQAAIAAPYAHATAPLRRLVDRWALAICVELAADRPAPAWARESLRELPAIMQASGKRASQLNAATINAVEAALLAPHLGHEFEATIIERRGDGEAPSRGRVQIATPPVTTTAPIPPEAVPGDVVTLTLVSADISSGLVEFESPEKSSTLRR